MTGINVSNPKVQVALNLLRAIDKLDYITIYIRDYTQLANNIDTLNRAILEEEVFNFVSFKSLCIGQNKQRMHV